MAGKYDGDKGGARSQSQHPLGLQGQQDQATALPGMTLPQGKVWGAAYGLTSRTITCSSSLLRALQEGPLCNGLRAPLLSTFRLDLACMSQHQEKVGRRGAPEAQSLLTEPCSSSLYPRPCREALPHS